MIPFLIIFSIITFIGGYYIGRKDGYYKGRNRGIEATLNKIFEFKE